MAKPSRSNPPVAVAALWFSSRPPLSPARSHQQLDSPLSASTCVSIVTVHLLHPPLLSMYCSPSCLSHSAAPTTGGCEPGASVSASALPSGPHETRRDERERAKRATHNLPSQKTAAPIMSVRTRVKLASCSSECTSRMSTRMLHGSARVGGSGGIVSEGGCVVVEGERGQEERRTRVAVPVDCARRPVRRNQVAAARFQHRVSISTSSRRVRGPAADNRPKTCAAARERQRRTGL